MNGRCRGFGLIEVLVAIVIFAVGMLGIAGLAVHTVRQETESAQRVEALVMMQDMVGRFLANRHAASCYSNAATGRTLGTANTATPSCTGAGADQAESDLVEWDSMLKGNSQRRADSSDNVGGLIGARGCIEEVSAAERLYRISVVWQGLAPTVEPDVSCGSDSYGDETQRRAVSVVVRLGVLS